MNKKGRGHGWKTLRKCTIIRLFRHYFCFSWRCFQIRNVCLVLHWNTLLVKVIWKVELIWVSSSWKTTHNGTKLVAFLPPCLLIYSSILPFFCYSCNTSSSKLILLYPPRRRASYLFISISIYVCVYIYIYIYIYISNNVLCYFKQN